MGDYSESNAAGKAPAMDPRGGAKRESAVEFAKHYNGDRCKLSLGGELRHGNAEQLFGVIFELYESGCTSVLLDLGDVSYCDTAGLQSLVQVYKYIQAKPNLGFRIYAPEGMVMDTLKTCRFDKFLQITSDAKELEGFEEAG